MRASRIPFFALLLSLTVWFAPAGTPLLASEPDTTHPRAQREGRSVAPTDSTRTSRIRFRAATDPKLPKTDLLESFDDEHSPLQTGMLDARDRAWSKKALLGSDPRCVRAARELARAADSTADRYPKLCHSEDGTHLERAECLELYCCPEGEGGSCPELACATALVEGTGLEACSTAPTRSVDGCVDEMFSKAQGKTRVLDCLDDPFDAEGEIRASCRNVLDRCPDLPLVRTTLDGARSGTIVDGQYRRVGRRIQTRTEILYDASEQRGRGGALVRASEAWEPIRIRRGPAAAEHEAVPGDDRHVRATLSAGSFNGDCDPLVRCAANDDGDCVDRATNERYGPDRCFDDEGRLRATLRLRSDCALPGAACCEHVGLDGVGTGERFHGDDCLIHPDLPATAENLRTTLVQMIDEDPVDGLNNDGDCTNGSAVTSDCLLPGGGLRPGFSFSVDEETACDGSNADRDCMGSGGRIGSIVGQTCVHDALAGGPVVIGSSAGVDFVALVDEDCPRPAGAADELDNDGDGLRAEDPPGGQALPLTAQSAEETACRDVYARVGAQAGVPDLAPSGDELPEGERACDFTRAMRVHANWQLGRDAARHEAFRHKSGKGKLFDVDAHGRWCDESLGNCGAESDERGAVHPGNVQDPRNHHGNGKSYAYEERRVTVDEVFAVKCKPVKDAATRDWVETFYDDATGSCVRVDAAWSGSSASAATGAAAPAACAGDACVEAMMGFTFAPPVLEWGWRLQERVCVFGFCFEIFYARVGYEFDLAAGLRLPVEIEFDGVPESVLSSQLMPPIAVRLMPLDFNAQQFREFCERHGLDDPWYIADCERFAFPDFLDPRDGDEFVARYSIFAGIIARLFMIPVLNWGIESAVDLPSMCTAWKMLDGIEGMSLADMLKLELGILDPDSDVLETLKSELGNCGSFTTPFGYEQCDALEPDCPPSGEKLRGWPFLELSKWIRADCFDALLNKEVVTIRGKTVPICTGLVLGSAGASLGVGLGLEATAGSLLIDADWSVGGDAAARGGELEFTVSADDPGHEAPAIAGVMPDNYVEMMDATHYQDLAAIRLDGFTYYLNAIELTLSAKLEFGGILSPIPDIASFRIYSFTFDTRQLGWDGIPIPQHPDTEPAVVTIPVENYALAVDVRPDTTLPAAPGCGADTPCPAYEVYVTNAGSRTDGIDGFLYELSNHALVAGCASRFGIDPNNDHDCIGTDGARHRENPFDGRADACFDACGLPLQGVIETKDEDPQGCSDPNAPCRTLEERDDDRDGLADEDGPGDDWSAAWYQDGVVVAAPSLAGIAAHTEAPMPVGLHITPLRHPLTAPGVYPFRVTADSRGAKANALPARDPLGHSRVQAPDEAMIEVVSFFDPDIAILPRSSTVAPGAAIAYGVEARNGSNVSDTLTVSTTFIDSNRAGCDLADRGSLPSCPDRAAHTAVSPAWLDSAPPASFGPLAPTAIDSASFALRVPADWAGMNDTVYRFELAAASTAGPGASDSELVEHTVRATLESRTRYVGLEIQALVDEIVRANAQGVSTGGLHPIATHPMQLAQQRALEGVLGGDARSAVSALNGCSRATRAFLYALQGSGGNGKIPEPWFADWRRRAEAIVADLALATQSSQ